MAASNNSGSQPVLQGVSNNTEAVQGLETAPMGGGEEKPIVRQEKSTINVMFKDWVPEEKVEVSEPTGREENTVPAGFNGRYFQVNSFNAHGRVRPGLGANLDDLLSRGKSKPKQKKRKKPPVELMDPAVVCKKFIITPGKPATALLNEINANLVYNFQEVKIEGSKAMPTFSCSVMYPPENGSEFFGEGRSKKLAKNDVAEKILAALGVEIPSKPEDVSMESEPTDGSQDGDAAMYDYSQHEPQFPAPIMPDPRLDFDFASDDIINVDFLGNAPRVLSQPMVDTIMLRRLRNIPNFEENVVLAMNTVLPNTAVEYEFTGEVGPPHDRKFTLTLRFNNQEFFGEGGSKKKAKADAAKKALIALLGDACYFGLVNQCPRMVQPSQQNAGQAMEVSGPSPKRKKKKKTSVSNTEEVAEEEDEEDSDDWGEYDLNFSDHISNVVREKYEELMGKDERFASYKVLAGVVMTTGSPMIFNSTVIAVTTGTKCIDGEFLSTQGLSVNDCHAEILSTRCVRDFLYNQIERFQQARTEEEKLKCILELNTEPNAESKYRVKSGVDFHLYISTSPCGDARIFSPKGIETEEPTPADMEDSHPNKLNRGVLRSKIEAGEGTIPSANLYNGKMNDQRGVNRDGPQTWDSIVSGSALYTMSCSDKVCRWNVLGFQGALLYNLIGSVFYSSITLGSLHHPIHFKRAVFGRLEPLNAKLDIPFSVKKPKLLMVSREEKRRVKKSPNHAVCWSVDWSTPEILAAPKGRCDGGVASRLTKRMAFNRFLKEYKNENGRRENYVDLTYHDAKQLAVSYQKAKETFVNFFKESNLGPWIGKPMEQDAFKIT